MKSCFPAVALALAAVAAAGTPARAAFIHDEAINGELSANRFAPSGPFTATAGGPNIISGTVFAPGGVIDLDYFTVVVPAGFQLDALTLLAYESDVIGEVSFLAVQAGTTFTEPPQPPFKTDVSNLLGYVLFGATQIDTDILPDIGTGSGAIGFTGPLPAGSYTFWVQETGDDPVRYSLGFGVSPAGGTPGDPIPEPAALLLAGTGALLGLGYARRRARPQAAAAR